jgi:hypothetical protein
MLALNNGPQKPPHPAWWLVPLAGYLFVLFALGGMFIFWFAF